MEAKTIKSIIALKVLFIFVMMLAFVTNAAESGVPPFGANTTEVKESSDEIPILKDGDFPGRAGEDYSSA